METLQIQEILISKIKTNPNNPRKIITPAMVDNMAASLKAVGLKNPIKVVAMADGSYEVISGHIRLAGATQLSWSTIPAVVLILTPEQALLEAILDNRGEPMTWLDTYTAVESMLKINPNLTQQAVGDQLGITQFAVSRAIKVLKAFNPASRQAVYSNTIKPEGYEVPETVAFCLSDLADPQKVEEALRVAIDKKLTAAQAKGLVTSIKAGGSAEAHIPAPKTKAIRPQKSATAEPITQPAHTPKPPTPNQMSETEQLAWDAAAGISVISRADSPNARAKAPAESTQSNHGSRLVASPQAIKTKIKKGERPSFFEALLLMGHYVWRVLVWLNKNSLKLIGHILKFTGKLLLKGLKSIAKALGQTFYKVALFVMIIVILGGIGWLAWDIYHYGPSHPSKLITGIVWPAHSTPAPTAVPTPAATPMPTTVAVVSTPAPQTMSKAVAPSDSGTQESAYVGDLEKASAPRSQTKAQDLSVPDSSPKGISHKEEMGTVTPVQPTPTIKKTDIAGDVLKQAAPAGVDAAKKLFGL